MLLCSNYWATVPIVVPLGGKVTVTSNISSLMKGLFERFVFNVVRVEAFVLVMSSEPGDHQFINLLLCSSNFIDEEYFSLLVCSYHQFILSLLLV